MISSVAVVGAVFSVLVAVGLPAVLLILLKKKTGKGIFAAVIGAACFIVFAMVLEQLFHSVMIPFVIGNAWLYGIYGCLAAGIFEETGRLVGLHFLCKKDSSPATGVGYGVGHGGIEAILVAGFSGIVNLVFMAQIGSGAITVGQPSGIYEAMMTVGPEMFWASGIERLSAIAVHLALSVLIYLVVTKRLPFVFYFVSIVLHALVNVGAVLYQLGVIQAIALVEGLIFITSLLICWLVAKLYQATKPKALAEEGEVDA